MKPGCLSAVIVMASFAMSARSAKLDESIDEEWRAASADAVWRSPTIEEREALREAMRILAAGAQQCAPQMLDAARRSLQLAGFELTPVADHVLIVKEVRGARRGGGIYAMRCGEARPWVFQAPHSFHDERTGGIVRKLFSESDARFAFWNTIHRYKSSPTERPEDPVHPADVAHEFGSLFQAATIGAAAGDRSLRFLQIHGFEDVTLDVDAVVSAGGAPGGNELLLAKGLSPLLGRVGTYGIDTGKYGALRNVQGRALAEAGPGRFLHIEFDAALRVKLRNDEGARQEFLRVLSQAW